jgi:hypothetical protein
MSRTETPDQHPANPRAVAWALLRSMLALLVQPHRWAELSTCQTRIEAAFAEAIKAQLLALPELAHLRGQIATVRTVWRGHRLDFDVLDASGRSLLSPTRHAPDRPPPDTRAIVRHNLRAAGRWICYRRNRLVAGFVLGQRCNPFRRGRMIALGRSQARIAPMAARAASAALQALSGDPHAANLAPQVPP